MTLWLRTERLCLRVGRSEPNKLYGGLLRENRELWTGPGRRMLLLKWALCASLLAELSLCPRLWTSIRSFPTIPAIEGLPNLPQPLSLALTWMLVAGVLLAAVLPRPRVVSVAVVVFGA